VVATLTLDVIGTNAKDELAFLGEDEAVKLRAELLARAAGFAPEAAPEVGEAPSRELVRVEPRMLAVSILLTGATWVLLALAVAVPALLWIATRGPWVPLAAFVPLLGGVWASSGGRFVGEYDWTVGESPDGLRVDRGLLDRIHETVPPGRVQTLYVVEPLLWRRRGWVRVELDVAGSKNEVLLPVAERAVAQALIGRVLPGVDLEGGGLVVAGVERARARWVVPVWWRGYGVGVDGSLFAARSGLLKRRLALVPHAKVQSVRFTQGPWQRRWGLADVHVDTGANKTVTGRLRKAGEARAMVAAQADRSRTGRREARPDRWMA
jgi:putative membrane protein